MNRLECDGIIIALIDSLAEHKSWCSETHIQKSAYFLSQLEENSVCFGFILYKHGPFSFDLRDELTALRARSFLELETTFPWGSRFRSTETGASLKGICDEFIAERQMAINFVAEKLAGCGVATLERLATALYFSSEDNRQNRMKKIRTAKPHITAELADDAISRVEKICEEWQALTTKSNV
jgi:uncharacterized protein YwgA